MLNEDKIKLMTGISMFEKREGRYLCPAGRYFKGDYLSRNMLRGFLGYSFCWLMGLAVAAVCRAEDIFSILDLEQMRAPLLRYGAWYLTGLAVYECIVWLVYSRRYDYGVQGQKVYMAKLKRLEKRYEFQSRTKELNREGRKT